jgi:hypothetical protein
MKLFDIIPLSGKDTTLAAERLALPSDIPKVRWTQFSGAWPDAGKYPQLQKRNQWQGQGLVW